MEGRGVRHAIRPAARVLAGALGLLASAAGAAQVPATQANFVACPIVRDTLDVPCFVADYGGERYFLAAQTGRGAGGTVIPPQLRHKVLVEGTITDEPRVCGGIVLKPVKLSPLMDEVADECNQLLPSGGYHATGPRVIGLDGDPPGPRKSTAFEPAFGQRKGLQERRQLYADNAAAKKEMTFTVSFFFNSDYIIYPIEQENVEDSVDYANLLKASRIEITAWRAAAQLSGGGELVEKPAVARQRAEKLAMILQDFGWPADKLTVRWQDAPVHNGGVEDYKRRRADIRVVP